jgi:EmrB/QacA subfamily drug resistance transporter
MQTNDRLWTPEVVGIATAFVLGAILTILDATIVNVALPVLARDFDASVATIQWVPTIYLLSFAAVIPLTGWASERYGAKRVWLVALALFLAGSLLCAAAQSVPQLLAARVLQGLGGGMVLPVGQSMLARVAGSHRMGRVMSIVGVPMLLAPIAGPVIGGALVAAGSWRWIFVVNAPVGVVALVMAIRLLPATPGSRDAQLDRRGLMLLPTGLAALVYGLADASAHGSLLATRPALAALIGVALVSLYVGHALRSTRALVDVRLFARRGFASAAATNLVLGIALFAVMLLLPLYLQGVRGLSPLHTGLLLIPQGLGAAFAMPVAGALTDRYDARRVVLAGTGVAFAGVAMFTTLTATTSYVTFCLALLLVGAGLGATITPAMAAGFRDLDHASMPAASSAIATVQRLAGSIGTALLGSLLQHESHVQPSLPQAFQATFTVALALTAFAVVPALFLPQSARKETAHDRGAQSHHRAVA